MTGPRTSLASAAAGVAAPPRACGQGTIAIPMAHRLSTTGPAC
ncbi:hypothetical protein [Elioraea tepida]|nr:hypothetical protein [Elioraea tepida]